MQGGTIVIECIGTNIASLLDRLVQAGVVVHDVEWVDKEKVRLSVSLSNSIQVWKEMKKLKISGRFVKRTGPFFWIKRLKKRKFFVFGFAIFLFLLFFFSSFIWSVKIEGLESIPTKHILFILQKEGIYPGQLKVGIPNTEQLQRKLLKQLPEASWVGVRLEGTRIIVTVAEKKKIDKIYEKNTAHRPVHLVAKKDALIMDMRITSGNPVVEVNDMVKKGQLLVSGTYGDPTSPEKGLVVGARGIVLGEVWYESEVAVPLRYIQNEYTGEKKRYTWPFVATYILTNPFQDLKPYPKFEVIRRVSALEIGKWRLPIGFVRDDYWSVRQLSYQRSEGQAVELGKERAQAEMTSIIGKEGRILTEKVLQKRVASGKVYLKLHFDVVENIAQEKPFLQGE